MQVGFFWLKENNEVISNHPLNSKKKYDIIVYFTRVVFWQLTKYVTLDGNDPGTLGTHISFFSRNDKCFKAVYVHASEQKYNTQLWAQLLLRDRNH